MLQVTLQRASSLCRLRLGPPFGPIPDATTRKERGPGKLVRGGGPATRRQHPEDVLKRALPSARSSANARCHRRRESRS